MGLHKCILTVQPLVYDDVTVSPLWPYGITHDNLVLSDEIDCQYPSTLRIAVF